MSDLPKYSHTVVRRLTAASSSAIAAIAVDGPQALELTRPALVTASGRPVRFDRACASFAHWRFSDPRLADEHVVVLVRDACAIEIHCHGGLAITERIIEQLRAAGCEILGSDLMTHPAAAANASERPSEDLENCISEPAIRRAARQAMQNATTLKASVVWLEQCQGALARDFARLSDLMTENKQFEAIELCDALLARAKFGMKLLQPWRLTLAGPPNVGKSSLMNALCGAARVLVHHEPGTTRDAIETNLVIGDWPILLTDTAGIHDTTETIERLGIETAWQRWRQADLGLLVVDATVGWTLQHEAMLAGPKMLVVVLNKTDAIDNWQLVAQALASIQHRVAAQGGVAITASARLDHGIEEIVCTIGNYLDQCRPARGTGIPFTGEQVDWLERQRAELLA